VVWEVWRVKGCDGGGVCVGVMRVVCGVWGVWCGVV